MSLKLIDTILNGWEDYNYEGLNEDIILEKPKVEDVLNDKVTKDIEELSNIKNNTNVIGDYDEEQILNFLADHNFGKNGYTIEERNNNDLKKIVPKIIKKNTKKILEIGFGSGYLTSLFLIHNDKSLVTSIDPGNMLYYWYGKIFIDYKFPGRHHLIINTATNLVPLRKKKKEDKYDLIWIKSNCMNLYDTCVLLKEYAGDHTTVIMDSICPHMNYGLLPYLTMLKLIRDKVFILEDHIKSDKNYTNGFAFLRYNSEFAKKYSSTENESEENLYKKIEINIPVKEFEDYIYNKHDDVGFNNSTIKKYARIFESLDIKLDKTLINYIREKFNINIE